jgi:proteasome lid subunit RPN8/RPN11
MTMAGLRIPADLQDRIFTEVAATLPNEACGVLGVADGVVTHVYPVANIAASPDEYTMDPAALVQALRRADSSGAPIGALYHSHPTGAVYPSVRDRATDVEHDWVHVIVGFVAEESVMRAFSVIRGSVAPMELVVSLDQPS